ncbi:leucine-rich repeat domain-containing protein [Stappia sp. MMSF_3263]|uniref:leucine-rich repeat domain-containing protein n=1 Tax=Stappia sp. MMSF_3263 TaxID=3046693 RepID=UPI00273E94CF|nr:hypothetical protein [Stappia sp. MMSF_3263]
MTRSQATDQAWRKDPEAAFAEAQRRIADCAKAGGEALYLGDLPLDRLPGEISALSELRQLRMYGGSISDFAPLSPLGALELLEIGSLNCAFPGLDFMDGWSALTSLGIIAPTAIDLAPLAACTGLARLRIWSTKEKVDLVHLDTLKELPALESLSLWGMQSDRFDMIGRWTRLGFIQLIDSNLGSLDGFETLERLETLSVRGAPVADLAPLAGLKGLRELDVGATRVRDLSPLARLARLESLVIAATPVADLGPLADLAGLQEETGRALRVERPFLHGTGLSHLDISGSGVKSLEPLARVGTLQRLELRDTAVTSLAPLHRLGALRSLDIATSRVVDLGPQGALSGLQILNAAQTPLESLAALYPARSLMSLNIGGTRVSDLAPLRLAHECRTLSLRGSQVADLRPIVEAGLHPADHRYPQEALDFRDTPAAHASPRLAELAALADESPSQCFFETRAYLREQTGWTARAKTVSQGGTQDGLRRPSRTAQRLANVSLVVICLAVLYLVFG